MSTFLFTASGIAALKPADKQTRHFDAKLKGLGLTVNTGGSKTFFVMYGPEVRRRQLTIGRHGDGHGKTLTLAQARQKASAVLGEIAEGGDPSEDRRVTRQAGTVADLVHVYLEEHASKKRSGYKDRQILTDYVLPEIGEIDLVNVRRPDVAGMLRKIEDADKPIARNRTFEVVRAMFNFGINDELERFRVLEFNPAASIKRLPEKGREAWLKPEQIGEYWLAVEELEEPLQSCLKLVVLSAQRQHQILEMRWNDVSLSERIWIVPADRTKGANTQSLPLTDHMAEIIGPLQSSSPWVFPGRSISGAVGHTYIHTPHRRIRTRLELGDFRLHDWRHTFMTLTKNKVGRNSCKLVLGHAESDTSAIYDHDDDMGPRRQALEEWQRIIMTSVNAARSDNVLAMP